MNNPYECAACAEKLPPGSDAWLDEGHLIHDDASCAWEWLKTNWSYIEIFEAIHIQKVVVGAE